MSKQNLIGKQFGRWTVIAEALNRKGSKSRVYWKCRCQCGTVKEVMAQNLINGCSKSCGCLNNELARQRMYKIREDRGLPSDGRKGLRLYLVWQNMNRRCSPEDRTGRYYSRHIVVCDEWRKFEIFRDWAETHGYTENLTIDRIDNNGNYEPSNCRWADKKTQARNKSNNHFVEFRGKQRTIAEVAEITGLKYCTIKDRVYRGQKLDDPLRNSK